MGGKRYDLEEMRLEWKRAPECSRAMVFWQALADQCDRPRIGLYKQLAIRAGWAAKVDKLQRCVMCGERFDWRDFVDGGPLRCCNGCASRIISGEEVIE